MKKSLALILCLMLCLCSCALAEPEAVTLPLTEEKATLTVYMQAPSGSLSMMTDLNESPTIQKLEELTNVHIEFICPPENDDGSFFNMLVASGEYPDMFIAADELGRDYPGQTDGAIEDGIVINPNELVEKYAPDYLAMYNSLSDKDKLVLKTDSGVYKLTGLGSNVVNGIQHTGLQIRKDWLDALGLEVPKTYEDFEKAMLAIKEAYDVTVPLAFAQFDDYFINNSNVLAAGYGVTWDGFILNDEGKVTHSYLQAGYRDFLEMMTRWMSEGIIDVDNINRTHDDCKKMYYTGRTAVIGIGNWETRTLIQTGPTEDPNFHSVPMSTLRKAGDDSVLGTASCLKRVSTESRFFISTACKNPELAMKWIDCLFKPEINLLTTFGIGDLGDGHTTYEINENGDYVRSAWMTSEENPDYPNGTNRHYIQNLTTEVPDSMELSQYDLPEHQENWKVWSEGVSDEKLVPGGVSLTSDESRTVSEVMTEIKTYMSELALKIICGEASLEDWDAAVANLDGMGIQKAIDAEQAALDRFNAR